MRRASESHVTADQRRLRFGLSLAGALLTSAVCAYELRDGVYLSPDGWEYWESSISLARGCGYAYFGGQPVRVYPPLFPVYLAFVQSILGVSGASLRVATTVLAFFSGGVWCWLVASVAGDEGRPRKLTLAACSFVVAYLGWRHWFLLSELMMLPLLGLMLIALLRLRPPDDGEATTPTGRAAFPIAVATACLTAMLLTRNAALAFVPGTALVVWLRLAHLDRARAAGITSMAIGATLAVWWGARLGLGLGGHPLSAGGKYGPTVYLDQLLDGLARHFGPEPWGWLVLGALAALCIDQQRRIRACGARGGAASDGLHLLVLALASVAALYATFNLTWINDELKGRFIVFAPLMILVAIVASDGWLRTRRPDSKLERYLRASTAIVAVAALSQTVMAIDLLTPGWPANVGPSQTLTTSHEIGLFGLIDAPTLVEPSERMAWIDERRGAALERTRELDGCIDWTSRAE